MEIFRLSQSNEHFSPNIGNPVELTILEFAERIRTEFPNAPKIIYEPLPEDDPKQRRPEYFEGEEVAGLGAESEPGRRVAAHAGIF